MTQRPSTEVVFLDDGYGGRVHRRAFRSGVLPCAHCGAAALFGYARTTATGRTLGAFCTILCCERSIRQGRF